MNSLIKILHANKWMNVIILFVYYLLVVLPHEKVGIIIAKIFEGQSRENYNLITLLIALVLFVILFTIIIRTVISHKERNLLILYFSITILYVLLCFNILFVMNIESIHFIQYAVFAILCYPLLNNFFQTLVFATIAGAFDEAYQYFYLAPNRTDYFDWNDVIINLVGAAIGVLILKTYLIKHIKLSKKFFKSPVFYFLCMIVLVVIALMSTGVLTVFSDDESIAAYTLVKVIPEGFWSYPPGPYVKYHVVMPMEGLIIISILWLFYYRLDASD